MSDETQKGKGMVSCRFGHARRRCTMKIARSFEMRMSASTINR